MRRICGAFTSDYPEKKESWQQQKLNLEMLRSGNRETKMSVGDEKEQRFYFLPCREEEEEEE